MRPYLNNSVFGMTRIPSMPTDHLVNAPHPHPASHITVLLKDAIYTLDVKDANGVAKSKEALENDLWLVIKDVQLPDAEVPVPVSVLTGAGRDEWTKVKRSQLAKSRS